MPGWQMLAPAFTPVRVKESDFLFALSEKTG